MTRALIEQPSNEGVRRPTAPLPMLVETRDRRVSMDVLIIPHVENFIASAL